MTAPIDTLGTDHPICPWCGHLHRDAFEWRMRDGDEEDTGECDSCGKPFVTTRNVTVTYDTRKP